MMPLTGVRISILDSVASSARRRCVNSNSWFCRSRRYAIASSRREVESRSFSMFNRRHSCAQFRDASAEVARDSARLGQFPLQGEDACGRDNPQFEQFVQAFEFTAQQFRLRQRCFDLCIDADDLVVCLPDLLFQLSNFQGERSRAGFKQSALTVNKRLDLGPTRDVPWQDRRKSRKTFVSSRSASNRAFRARSSNNWLYTIDTSARSTVSSSRNTTSFASTTSPSLTRISPTTPPSGCWMTCGLYSTWMVPKAITAPEILAVMLQVPSTPTSTKIAENPIAMGNDARHTLSFWVMIRCGVRLNAARPGNFSVRIPEPPADFRLA